MVTASTWQTDVSTNGRLTFPSDSITSLFQPIVYVNEQTRLVAVEALARGPRQTAYENPMALFAAARRSGTVAQLDRLCITNALVGATILPAYVNVFLNVHPSTLCEDVSFPAFLTESAAKVGIAPQRITLELLEHARVNSCHCQQLQSAVHVLRGYGARLAVDDITGASDDLRRALSLNPDFLKVDGDLIRDSVGDLRRRAVLQAVCEQARRANAHVIAEGIEQPAALDVARTAGITFAQGYLLGRPATAEIVAARVRNR